MDLLSCWYSLLNDFVYRSVQQWKSSQAGDLTTSSTSHRKKRSSSSCNAKIERLLKADPDIHNIKDTEGFVYILIAEHNGSPLIKIGHTTSPDVRRRSHSSTCRGLKFKAETDAFPDQPIRAYYKLVEKLAQEELQSLNQPFLCTCGTRHREYYHRTVAVAPSVAHSVIRRWIRFCEKQPWRFAPDAKSGHGYVGRLKNQWLDRLDRRRDWIHGTGPVGGRLETGLALWDGFVDPGLAETLREYVSLALLVLTLLVFSGFCVRVGCMLAALGVLLVLSGVLLYARWQGYEGVREHVVDGLWVSLLFFSGFCMWVGHLWLAFKVALVMAGVLLCRFFQQQCESW